MLSCNFMSSDKFASKKMSQTHARIREQRPMSSSTDCNINTITMDVISEVEKELLDSPYDMNSLVFLLYEVPDTALQRLLVYQRVSKDIYSTNMNLLHEWVQKAKAKVSWREEFLEALLICQLYGIVRKLGFDIRSLKRQYQAENIYFYKFVNPIKKTLYKLCEKMDCNSLNTLKRTLLTFRIDTTDYDSCELVFLKLMSEKVITCTEFQIKVETSNNDLNFNKLIKLMRKLPGLESFSNELSMLENRNGDKFIEPAAASSPSDPASDDSMAQPSHMAPHIDHAFDSVFDILGRLDFDENQMKADSKKSARDRYQIKDPNRIGLCLIINQEDFHLCNQSIEDRNLKVSLPKRKGSTYDKIELERTMSALNFEVISKDNLNKSEMLDFIKTSIKQRVKGSTSIFMLCILSHGVRDHVFAADSVKVKVEDIQKLLDSDDAMKLRGIPKVLILQACQVDDEPQMTIVADSPKSDDFYLGKSDFLVYWATSPEYEAYRVEEAGSIFIQCLCKVIHREGKVEHLQDLFTKNNDAVHFRCNRIRIHQMPMIKTSLRKKLYLYVPQ